MHYIFLSQHLIFLLAIDFLFKYCDTTHRQGSLFDSIIMKPLSASILNNVENLLNQGKSSRSIAQTLGISKSVVNKVRPRLAAPAQHPQPGAPPKLSPRQKQDLVIHYKRGKVKTAVEATKMINSTLERPVSCDTVRRAFRELGYYAKKKTKKPKLSKRHRAEIQVGPRT